MPTEPKTVRVECEVCAVGVRFGPAKKCPTCGGVGSYLATLIPIVGGPVVVEKKALRAAAVAALKDQSKLVEDEWDECGWEGIDTWEEAVELLRGAMLAGLAALFPTGLVVAEAVGEVHMECGEPVIGTAEAGRHITGCRVAVLTANG